MSSAISDSLSFKCFLKMPESPSSILLTKKRTPTLINMMPISIKTEDKIIVVVLSKLRPLRKKMAAKMVTMVEKPKMINIVSRNSLRDEQRCDGVLSA